MDLHWIDLVIILAAAARVWHLGGTDRITDPVRDHTHGSVRQWLTCPRCSGLWWALAIAPAWLGLRYGFTVEHMIAAEIVALGANWAFWATRDLINDVLDVLAAGREDQADDAVTAAEYAAAERINGPVSGRE